LTTVRLEIPNEATPVVLSNPESAQKWAQQELEFWTPLASAMSATPYKVDWRSAEASLRSIAAGDLSTLPVERIQSALTAAVGVLQLTSRDPRAQLLSTLASQGEDPYILGITLQLFVSRESLGALNWQNPKNMVAVAHAAAYRAVLAGAGSPKRVIESRAVLDRMLVESRDQLAGLQSALESSHAALAEFRTDAAQSREKAETALRVANDAFSEMQSTIQRRLSTDLALRAPVQYWSEKADYHKRRASAFLRAFVWTAAIGLVAMTAIAVGWLVPEMRNETGAWWAIALFSALLALWAWPLRLTSKLFLSHSHLREDASEREVVTKTFLALGDAVKLTDNDRQLLLAALFRTSSAGLVKDDGSLSLSDLLLARMAGSKE
jgi:hypothetical protein